jgi:hypothetical protein
MTDRNELRRLAEAVRYIATDGWLDDDDLVSIHPIFSAFIAAASPAAVLALLDERDEARAAVKRLAGALEELSGITVYNAIDRSPLTPTQIRNVVDEASRYAKDALADPVVKRIVEGG